ENRYSAAGAAVSAMLAPESSEVVHGNVVQLTPVPVTVPAPLACTVSAYLTRLKVATTVVPPAGTVTWQLPAPAHGPGNASVDSAAGGPSTVTTVPGGMLAEHTAPQLRLPPPAQVAVTVPVPLPCFEITKVAFLRANVAFTVVALVIAVSAQVAPVVVVQPD